MPYPHSITRHKYWIYKTTRQARPVKFVIIHSHHTTLYESDTVHIKKPSFQELLLYKMVGDPSFPRPYLFIERPLTSLLVRKTTSKTTSFSHVWFYIQVSIQSTPKNLFATSAIQPIQITLGARRTRESCEDRKHPWFDLSLLSRNMGKW